ncbi:MAG: hypothetical protein NVS2B16_22810 [Chloroflexota bacterium]
MANNNVSRYQPQSGMTRLPDLMDRLFQESFVLPTVLDRWNGGNGRSALPVNLYEAGDGYVLQAALPGLQADSTDIQVIGRDVTIKGSFATSVPENVNWIWRGIGGGEFQETYTLPVEVQSDKVEATYENGILALNLPKAEHLRPKSIKVSVNK